MTAKALRVFAGGDGRRDAALLAAAIDIGQIEGGFIQGMGWLIESPPPNRGCEHATNPYSRYVSGLQLMRGTSADSVGYCRASLGRRSDVLSATRKVR